MNILKVIVGLLAAAVCIIQAQPVSISGKVTSAMGTPVKGAIVELLSDQMADTTDSNGIYQLGSTAIANTTPLSGPDALQRVCYDGKNFILFSSSPTAVSLKVFSLSGALLATPYCGRINSGETRIGFGLGKLGSNIFLLNIRSNGMNDTYKFSSITGKSFSAVRISPSKSLGGLGKSSAADSLQASKPGYVTYVKELSSLTGTCNITLETEGTGSAGATIFWDFEDGKLPAGAKAAAYPGGNPVGQMPVVDKSRAYKGTYGLHYATMHSAYNRIFMYTLPANWGPVMWVRAYMNFTPSLPINIPPDGSSHGTMFKGIYNPQRYWYETGVELGKFLQIQHIPEPPGYPEWCIFNNKVPPADVWLCLEWEFNGVKDSTNNATEPRFFINGEEIPVTSRTLWDNGFQPNKPAGKYLPAQDFIEIWMGLQAWHQWTGFDDFWFDDVAISKTRIGIK
jgi:hypothetical protein